jgi:hypothetical protein
VIGTASVARGRGVHWLLSAIVAAFLIGLCSVVLAAVRPQVVFADEPIPVTVSFTVAPSRPYDGTTDAPILTCDIEDGVVGDDDVTCLVNSGALADYADENVGTDIAVSADPEDFSLDGDDASNYIIGTVDETSADITARDLTPTAHGVNKTYDGGTGATVTFTDDRLGTDTFSYTYLASFGDKNVATGKSVSVSNIAITGGDSGNYQLTTTAGSTSADITVRDLTPTAHGVNRGYDGTKAASVTFTDDRVSGDAFNYSYLAEFNNRNVGTSKPISVTSIAISTGDAGNYQLTTTTGSTTANVAQAPLTITAIANIKTADGGVLASATPTVSGTVYSPDVAKFRERYSTAAAADNKTMIPSGFVDDGNSGNNYSYDFQNVTTGRIRPAAAATITFLTQPIDTKTNTPIYAVCVPSGGANPCAPAGSTSTDSTPIKVEARDAYNNLAGPGAPGADTVGQPAITITIRRDTTGGTVLGSAMTDNGVASLGDQLKINVFPLPLNNKLHATATGGVTGTISPTLSNKFDILTDVFACDGTKCNNNGNNNAGNKLQKAAGQITTGGDFFTAGTTNVLLTTRFTPGSDTNQTDGCGYNAAKKINVTIGDATDLQVTGTNVGGTNPATAMVVIMPKNTLKTYGITARGTDSFDVCLGALKVATGGPTHWTAKHPTNKNGGTVLSKSGSEGREWGVPANCGATGLSSIDPCVGLRTKQAATLRTYLTSLGWTTAQINAIGMADADFAMVIRKGPPWDAKVGVH